MNRGTNLAAWTMRMVTYSLMLMVYLAISRDHLRNSHPVFAVIEVAVVMLICRGVSAAFFPRRDKEGNRAKAGWYFGQVFKFGAMAVFYPIYVIIRAYTPVSDIAFLAEMAVIILAVDIFLLLVFMSYTGREHIGRGGRYVYGRARGRGR